MTTAIASRSRMKLRFKGRAPSWMSLRKRLGQPSRPPVELDYLERLVKPYQPHSLAPTPVLARYWLYGMNEAGRVCGGGMQIDELVDNFSFSTTGRTGIAILIELGPRDLTRWMTPNALRRRRCGVAQARSGCLASKKAKGRMRYRLPRRQRRPYRSRGLSPSFSC